MTTRSPAPRRRSRPSSALAYAVVVVALLAYFAWILDRMAYFEHGGIVRLDKLVAGLVILIAGPAAIYGILALASSARARRRTGPRTARRPHERAL